jgi:hypothetical protein
VIRPAFAALGAAVRNENIRRAELAWGAAIAAEWAHFVGFSPQSPDIPRRAPPARRSPKRGLHERGSRPSPDRWRMQTFDEVVTHVRQTVPQ